LGGPLYVNAENDAARAKARAADVLFSRAGAGDWRVTAPETSLEGTSFVLERDNERIEAQSALLGLHHIGALAAGAHLARSLGLSIAQIEAGIAKTKPFAHRLERYDDASEAVFLDDTYNGNPDGVRAVIDFLASIRDRTRWYVTPGLVEMGAKSEEIHREIGHRLAAVGIEKVALIRNSVTPWIEQGLKEKNYRGEVLWFDEALRCYAALPHLVAARDVVLLQNDWPDQYA
jgi:UDP-N-acetylmuramyl pentapeptide synthase